MSSIRGSNISMECVVNDLLKENCNWVDERLEELYHGYGLTYDNYYDYIDAGLLVERGAWVDEELQRQFDSEFEDIVLCSASMNWVLYNETPEQYCLEKDEYSRSRAESDISDHSAEVERVLKRINSSYLYAVADEVVSVTSNHEEFENCSPISAGSEMSYLDMNDPFYEYCCENRFK